MKIEKVTFQATYNTGPFLNVRVGFEAEMTPPVMGTDGTFHIESPEQALSNLKKMADAWHKAEYPHIYQQESAPEIVRSFTPQQTGPSVSVIDYKEKENLEIAIDNATSLEDLAKLKEQAGKQGLIHPYMQKMNELLAPKQFTDGL